MHQPPQMTPSPLAGVDYPEAAENARFQETMLWHVFGSFVLAETVFAAAILQTLATRPSVWTSNVGHFVAGLFGMLSCLAWFGAHQRNRGFMNLAIAQVKDRDPTGQGPTIEATPFSKGEAVIIRGDSYFLRGVARRSVSSWGIFLMMVFGMLYLFVAIARGPWWPPAP